MLPVNTLILTNLIPEKNKQIQHDIVIKNWVGEKNAVTVIEFLTDNLKGKYLQPDNALQWLIDTVKKYGDSMNLIDASRDHYWRDVLETHTGPEIKIEHKPYPDKIFQINFHHSE